ncbi:MAG TPA: 50S ribosomal protein L15 [Acidimicrobiales bacterium]|nr:50S ribosomal protein L15 [Acidimicrobiales bacterium]
MKIHDLKPAPGSNRRRKRVARGIAGKGGKTAGKGTKGQKARDTIPARFEGGQLPLVQRVPKRKGFTNPFRIEYAAVNLDTIEAAEGTDIDPGTLRSQGLVHKHGLVKVLGRGELTRKVNVSAHAFSASAEAAITAAGGTVTKLPLPWGDRRPPAKGNQHTNR